MIQADLTVLYNENCPICRAEIAHYRSYSEARDLPIRFEDLHQTDLAAWGVDAEQAARRLHVRTGGKALSGIDAFIALWKAMPRYRWLGRLVSVPGLHGLADVVYNRVLAPWLYRKHLRRQQIQV